MYDNARDAIRYLENSIIRIKQTPVLVRSCWEDGRKVMLEIQYLRSGKRKIIDINDKSLNFKPVPLGYGVDERGVVFFAIRYPRRKWKQGLHRESLRFSPKLLGKVYLDNKGGRLALANTIQGRFKSFKDALLEGGVFHRHFRIHKKLVDTLLEYKGERIGAFHEGKLELLEEHTYLEKYIEEVMV